MAPLVDALAGNTKYEKVRDVSSGAFGFVQLCRDKCTGEQCAIKFIPRGESVNANVEREIMNHRVLIHPNIIQFKEAFVTDSYLGIAMEYAPGGDLFEHLIERDGDLTEDEARGFFLQLVIGVDYCHQKGIVNRDIKLENTLLDGSCPPKIKICDFGYSKHEGWHSAPHSRVGTPDYLAPEIVGAAQGQTYDGKVSDIWSCGVMLYTLVIGTSPFERPEDRNSNKRLLQILKRIMDVDYRIPAGFNVSDDFRDLLSCILVADPLKRITIEGILQHPWCARSCPVKIGPLPPQPTSMQSEEEVRRAIEESRRQAPAAHH